MAEKPKMAVGPAEKELIKAEEQFQQFDDNIKSLTMDRMNMAPKVEHEPQTKLAQSEIQKKPDIYLKPHKTIGVRP